MNLLVADTHVVIWYFLNSPRLSSAAAAALDSAVTILLPSICMVGTLYLVEKGRIPRVAWDRLRAELADPGSALALAPLDLAVVEAMTRIPRSAVPDLPDRVIAATALRRQAPLV